MVREAALVIRLSDNVKNNVGQERKKASDSLHKSLGPVEK